MNTMKNTCKEAASPLLTTQAMPGSGMCRAMLRGRSSGLKGADASRCDRPAGRPLTPETSAAPGGRKSGQASSLPRPGARRAGPAVAGRRRALDARERK